MTLRALHNLVISLVAALLILMAGHPAQACVEGLDWGMSLDQVSSQLGAVHHTSADQPQRYVVSHGHLDQIPVPKLTFELDQVKGLQSLAYEFDVNDMTEILAGLRAKHGQPLSTSIEDRQHNKQFWVWNTGDDLITAIQSHSSTGQKFLIGYRPSRLRPEIL